MYPVVYIQKDSRNNKAFRVAVVSALGKFEDHSNYGVYDVETSEQYSNNKGRFDSEKAARGLFTTGSQSAPTEFVKLENVNKDKIASLIDEVKNFTK
jgi:hypothetical protein